jgi:hypothetical protein
MQQYRFIVTAPTNILLAKIFHLKIHYLPVTLVMQIFFGDLYNRCYCIIHNLGEIYNGLQISIR